MSTRRRLPNRRASEIFSFDHAGHTYTASWSRFADGWPAEIFLDVGKAGSTVALHAQDSAVLVSLLLQHHVDAADIQHSIAGPCAVALRIIAEGSGQ